MPPSTYSEPVIGTKLAKSGKGGGSTGLREEDFLPVALTLLIHFRSFFSLLDDGLGYERITDVLAGVTATSYKSSCVFQRRGAQLALARAFYHYLSQCLPGDLKLLSTKRRPFSKMQMHHGKQHLCLSPKSRFSFCCCSPSPSRLFRSTPTLIRYASVA